MPAPDATQVAERAEEVRFGGRRLRAGALLDVAGRVREAGIAVALGLLVLVVAIIEPRFIEPNNLEEILLSVSILAIVAVGQTLVVLTRNIDLSVGSNVGLVAFVCADTLKGSPETSVALIVVLGVLLGAGLGVVNGLLVTVGRVPAIVATLGTPTSSAASTSRSRAARRSAPPMFPTPTSTWRPAACSGSRR